LNEISTERGVTLQITATVTIHAIAVTVLLYIQRHRLVVFAVDALFDDAAAVCATHAPPLRIVGKSDVGSGTASADLAPNGRTGSWSSAV
jgi:hypothetical protein